MRTPYNRKLAVILARCCVAAYHQYTKGHFIPPTGYTVVAELKASFTWLNILLAYCNRWYSRWLRWLLLPCIWLVDLLPFVRKPFGFALAAKKGDHYIVAFRGTQDLGDWFTDADAVQVKLSHKLRGEATGLDKTQVHQGFQLLALSLSKQVSAAAAKFKPKVPVYVTGHSLGGAVAALIALMLRTRMKRPEVRMYSYAAPRVGDPAFVAAYDALLPTSYRVVNLADVVPVVPPRQLEGWRYADLGTEWGFLNQSGDVVGNHGMEARNNYLDASVKGVPSDKARKYPISAFK